MLSKNLKTLRKVKGWTAEQTARKLKIKLPTYQSYESNRGIEPNIKTLIKISDLYKITVDKLVREEIKILIK
jgi:transcriptional regulator with XRE-family HTH domain